MGDKESIGCESIYDIVCSTSAIDYFKFFFWSLVGNYSEWIGFELILVIIGVMKDKNVLLAWIAMQSLMYIVINIGGGFSYAISIYTGNKLGVGNWKEAKRLSHYGWLYAFVVSLIFMVLIELNYKSIA